MRVSDAIAAVAGRNRAARRRQVHVLHIGKTGGSQLIRLCREVNGLVGRDLFLPREHRVRLADLPPRADYIFGTRAPAARFRSAFYSRKRQGRPLYDVPWRPDEALAFAAFPEANDLAEALFDEGRRGDQARAAIQSITHAAEQQVDWFTPLGFFLDRRPPLAIIRQEAFDADWQRLAAGMGLTDPPRPSRDPVAAHSNDYAGTPPLSDRAQANLAQWYARDVAFHARCSAFAADPPPLPGWLIEAARP